MENFNTSELTNENKANQNTHLLEEAGFTAPEKNAAQGTAKEENAGDVIPNRYIVKLKDQGLGGKPANPGVIDPIDKIMNRIGLLPNNDTLIYRDALTGFATRLSAQQKAALQADPDVAYIEEDRVVGIKPLNVGQVQAAASTEKIPRGVARIEADKSPTANAGQAVDVDVAVIDTGINLKHSELNVVANVSFVPKVDSGACGRCRFRTVVGLFG